MTPVAQAIVYELRAIRKRSQLLVTEHSGVSDQMRVSLLI
jgi:hypothetical protein